MAALTATNWTTTIVDRWRASDKRHTKATLVLGTSTRSYPSGGVPLPTYGTLGFYKYVDTVILAGGNFQGGFAWDYNTTGHSLRAYRGGATGAVLSSVTVGTVMATGARTINVVAIGG